MKAANTRMAKGNMTMTERKQPLSQGRREQGSSLAWKSGLMASSVGAVLMGWALLGRLEAAPASTVTQIVSPEPRVIVVQVPIPNVSSSGTQQNVVQTTAPVAQANTQANTEASTQASTPAVSEPSAPAPASPQIVMPAMPERPVFQQPVTQTRGS